MNLKETKALMAEYNIRPTHSLGQNFLVDETVVQRICELAEITAKDRILEIGPGLGHLTIALASRAAAVTTIEIDRHILPALQATLQSYPSVHLIHADALQVDFQAALSDSAAPSPALTSPAVAPTAPEHLKVVANLPYYVTTELLLKLMLEVPQCSGLWLMMQKEAADRIAAPPGTRDYGPVGVIARCLGSLKRALLVGRGSFYPQPHVDSAVLQLVLDPPQKRLIEPQDLKGFADFVQRCFAQRRKTLVNSLRLPNSLALAFAGASTLADLLEAQGLRRDVRAEALTPAQFANLYHSILEKAKIV